MISTSRFVKFGLCALLALTLGVWAADSKPAAINDKCPMSGQAVDGEKTTEVKVAFCCNNCKGKFEKEPGKFLEKVSKSKETDCPMSGQAADKEATASVKVAFCCGNCKGKFDKDSRANLAKVKVKESQ